MSLANDYQMYYNETFVSFEGRNGEQIPMMVVDVRWIGDTPDDEWDSNNVHLLRFRGHVLYKDGSRYRINEDTVWKTFDELNFEVPELGYFLVEGMDRPVWIAALPQRSAKKGFTLRKTNIGRNLDRSEQYRVVYETYNSSKSYAERNFCFDGRNIDYKGIRIGQYETDENGIRTIRGINPLAEYLREMIEELFNANTNPQQR